MCAHVCQGRVQEEKNQMKKKGRGEGCRRAVVMHLGSVSEEPALS